MLKNSSSLYEDQLNVSQGDKLWLWDQIEDPQIDPNTQQVIGYYRAKSMIDTKDTNNTAKEKEKEKEKEKNLKNKSDSKKSESKVEIDRDDHTLWSKVPSNVVRKATEHEERSCRKGMLPTWTKIYDPSSVKYYYYNNFTQESVWEEPSDYKGT